MDAWFVIYLYNTFITPLLQKKQITEKTQKINKFSIFFILTCLVGIRRGCVVGWFEGRFEGNPIGWYVGIGDGRDVGCL